MPNDLEICSSPRLARLTGPVKLEIPVWPGSPIRLPQGQRRVAIGAAVNSAAKLAFAAHLECIKFTRPTTRLLFAERKRWNQNRQAHLQNFLLAALLQALGFEHWPVCETDAVALASARGADGPVLEWLGEALNENETSGKPN